MREEEAALREQYIEEDAYEQLLRMRDERLEVMRYELEKKFEAKQVEREIEKERVIQQLMESAALRGNKKKKKKKGRK